MRQDELLRVIKANPKITQAQLGKKTGLSRKKVYEQIKKLIEKGKVRRTKFKNTYYLYTIAKVGRADSTDHRTRVKDKVREAMTRNPHTDLRGLAKMVGSSIATVSSAYNQCRRDKL